VAFPRHKQARTKTHWHGVFPAVTTQFKKDQSLDLYCPRTRRNKFPGPIGNAIELVCTGPPTFSQELELPKVTACCT